MLEMLQPLKLLSMISNSSEPACLPSSVLGRDLLVISWRVNDRGLDEDRVVFGSVLGMCLLVHHPLRIPSESVIPCAKALMQRLGPYGPLFYDHVDDVGSRFEGFGS